MSPVLPLSGKFTGCAAGLSNGPKEAHIPIPSRGSLVTLQGKTGLVGKTKTRDGAPGDHSGLS